MPSTRVDSSRMLSHLPEEIILHILSYLPVKSVVRFRCTCKRWHFLLSGNYHHFNALHLHNRRHQCRHSYLLKAHVPDKLPPLDCITTQSPGFIIVPYNLTLVSGDANQDQPVHLEPPKPLVDETRHVYTLPHRTLVESQPTYTCLNVIGSIDGLFCLTFNWGNCVVLWNPATRDWYQLPNPEFQVVKSFPVFIDAWTCGFAYDHSHGGGYKVVRIVYRLPGFRKIFRPPSNYHSPGSHNYSGKAEVYDTRKGSWCKIANPPNLDFGDNSCRVIVKGVPYWHNDFNNDTVISFNPQLDEFRIFKRPDFGAEGRRFQWRLGEIRESLVMFVRKEDKGIDIWKMMDDDICIGYVGGSVSWSKQFSIGPLDGVARWLKCWKDGEFLVTTSYDNERNNGLYVYNPWSMETRNFPEFQEGHMWHEVYVYEESMVSPRPCAHSV